VTALLRQIDRVVDGRALARGLLVLAPLIAATLGAGDTLWMNGALITASAFIAMEETGLAPLGVALHGLAICASFLVLIAALRFPPLFALAAAALAAGAILLTAKGHRMRALGSFTFIPALYLAYEFGRIGGGSAFARGLAFLPYAAFALVPVLLLSAAEHWRERSPDVRRWAHLGRIWRRGVDFGAEVPFGAAVISAALAVSVAALLVGWARVPRAQWVVWSAASVVTGDAASAWRKLGDRMIGVLAGAPIGVICALFAPHEPWVLPLAGLGALLTLFAFRIYRVGFGARCALVAFALTAAGQSGGAAVRIADVLLGGAVGFAFVLAVHELRLVQRRKPSARFRLRAGLVAPAPLPERSSNSHGED
jgi:hypothetical protein